MKHLSRIVLVFGLVTGVAQAQSPAPAAATAEVKPTAAAPAAGDTPARKPNYATSKDPAPGGARNLVWANSHTKRYHCYGTKYYGRTYQGAYTDETEAIEDGFKPSNRTGCSQ